MKRAQLVEFVRRHRLAVQASNSTEGTPQAAVVGIVVTDELEVFFDTLADSRKARNLRRDPRVSLVVGWDMDEACTLQLEGVADEPQGLELEALLRRYLLAFPDGAERAATGNIAYFRVRPTWLRFSDFRGDAPKIVELRADALAD